MSNIVQFKPAPPKDAQEEVYRGWFDFLQLSVVKPVYPVQERHICDKKGGTS